MTATSIEELRSLNLSQRFYARLDRENVYGPAGAPEPPETDLPSADIVAGSIASYAAGVPADIRNDVNNCMLLAQFAADSKFARSYPSHEWFAEFERWLKICGWVVQGRAFKRLSTEHATMDVAKEIIQFLKSATGAGVLPMIEAALDSLSKMDAESALIKLFESESSCNGKGAFQISEANIGAEGAIAVTLGQFNYETTDVKKKFLFFGWKSEAVRLMASVSTCSFLSASYAPVKKLVEEKLAPYQQASILGLKL